MRLNTILAALSGFLLLSCGSDNIGTEYSGPSGFAFPSAVVNAEVSGADNNQILIPVSRGSFDESIAELSFEFDASNGSATPQWSAKDPQGIFSLMTPNVIFPDDSYTAFAMVRFSNIDKLGLTTKYRIKLTIKDKLSPSGRNTVIVTVGRKLTFEFYGDADFHDTCIFDHAYPCKVFKATEAEVFRVMDPYTEGLVAEEYAAYNCMGDAPEHIQFVCDKEGDIVFEPFNTGMLVNGFQAWAYYPGEYVWGRDFSVYNEKNRRLSDKVFQLYPVYCLPDFQHGFLNEGAYQLTITMK